MDSELSFDQNVSSICTKASKKLHPPGRIAGFMSFEKRRTLMKGFIESQFNYCLVIWMSHSRTMNNNNRKRLCKSHFFHFSLFPFCRSPLSLFVTQEVCDQDRNYFIGHTGKCFLGSSVFEHDMSCAL